MGCNSSINIQTKENIDTRIIKINKDKENKITQNDYIQNDNNNQDHFEYLEIESIKKERNENTDSKTMVNHNISDIHNMKINKNLYNYKSTNYKYLKEEQKNLNKSNPILKDKNKEISYNNVEYITLKHPLDKSSNDIEDADNNADNKIENKLENKRENINVTTSMEQRINNYKSGKNEKIEEDEEDGVNMVNYKDEENEDMCNFGQSMENEEIKKNISDKKEICVIFEIQSTGEKYNLKAKQGIKLSDLIEMFKKKIDLSSFERPEFMFKGVYLIDYDKPIEDYNITDKSKINVYI